MFIKAILRNISSSNNNQFRASISLPVFLLVKKMPRQNVSLRLVFPHIWLVALHGEGHLQLVSMEMSRLGLTACNISQVWGKASLLYFYQWEPVVKCFFFDYLYLSEMFHNMAFISVPSDGASFVDSTEVYNFSLSFLRFKLHPVSTIFP